MIYMKLVHLIWLIPVSVLMSLVINHLANTLPVFRKIVLYPICPHCEERTNLYNFYLKRSCPKCGMKTPKRNFVLIFLFIITYVLIYYFPPNYSGPFIALIIFTFLSLVFIIDLEHRLILHPVSIFGAILFFVLGGILNGWQETLLGGGAGFLFMYLLYLFGILFTKWMSKRKGTVADEVALGFGDVNLSAILGLLFGWPRIIVLLFFTILLGGIFSAVYLLIMRIRKKYELFTAIPYAPFLIISAIILLYISTPS